VRSRPWKGTLIRRGSNGRIQPTGGEGRLVTVLRVKEELGRGDRLTKRSASISYKREASSRRGGKAPAVKKTTFQFFPSGGVLFHQSGKESNLEGRCPLGKNSRERPTFATSMEVSCYGKNLRVSLITGGKGGMKSGGPHASLLRFLSI